MIVRVPSEFDLRTKKIVLTDEYINKIDFLEEMIEKF